jgi:hypothetical protein
LADLAYTFGPIPNLRFDTEVGRFLRRSPTEVELGALRLFFERLTSDPISVGQNARAVTADTWLFNVANHNIYLRLTGPGRGVVVGIRPDSLSQGVEVPFEWGTSAGSTGEESEGENTDWGASPGASTPQVHR